MPFTTRKLLTIDGLAAIFATLLILSLLPYLPSWLYLPTGLFYLLSTISFCYALYAFGLSRQRKIKRWQLQVLAFGNAAYGVFCVFLMVFFFNVTNSLGLLYLCIDAVIVTGLAYIEFHHCAQMQA